MIYMYICIFVDAVQYLIMYLPSFYKIKFEKYAFNVKRAAPFAVVPLIWLSWTFWPNIYNTIYTDLIPPKRGVARRIKE